MKKNNSPTNFKKYILILWLLFVVPILLVITTFTYLIFFADLPSLQELENPKTNLASEVISADQKVIGKYYIENRTDVKYENLSKYLVNALVATEDARFYQHSGVDFRALLRSIK